MRTSLILALGLILSLIVISSTQEQTADVGEELSIAKCREMVSNEPEDLEDQHDEEDDANEGGQTLSPARKAFRFFKRRGQCGVQDPDLKDDAVSIFNLPKNLKKKQVRIVKLRLCFSSQRSYEYYQAIMTSLRIRIKKTTSKTHRKLLQLQLKELRAESKRVERSVSVRSFKKQMKIDASAHARQIARNLNRSGLDSSIVRKLTGNRNLVRQLTRVAEQDERMHELARDMVKCQRKLNRRNLGKAEREVFNMVREGVRSQMRSVSRRIKKESSVFRKACGNKYAVFRKMTDFSKHVVKVVKTKKVVKRKRVVRRG